MPPRYAYAAAALALLTIAAGPAHAGEPLIPAYPVQPIRLVVIPVPGGSTDLLARLAAQHLGDAPGRQMLIDSAKRAGIFSDLPTIAEAPLPDLDVIAWSGW
jgi:hypothetical protein